MRKFKTRNMKTLKEVILMAILLFVGTSLIWYAIYNPMGRSEAHSILLERGTVIMNKGVIEIYLEQGPTTLELEAVAKLSKSYEGVYLYVNELK